MPPTVDMGIPGASSSVADDPTRKRVLLAEPRGYCAGVDRAVETVERALKKKDAGLLVFESSQAITRFEKMGDLFEPVLELKQKLPDLKAAAMTKEPEPIEIAAQADEDRPARKSASKKSGKKPAARKKGAKV